MSKPQTPGRKVNAAQPLSERKGTDSEKQTQQTGETARRSAGPDGPDAGVVGATFKK
jgi:hypothetical protein